MGEFALVARQMKLLTGSKCTAPTANDAFRDGCAASHASEGLDFHGFFVALQMLRRHREDLGLTCGVIDDHQAYFDPSNDDSMARAACSSSATEIMRSESYAEECAGRFSHRLRALFRYCVNQADDMMNMCDAHVTD